MLVMVSAQRDHIARARLVRVVASVMQVNVFAVAAGSLAFWRTLDLAAANGSLSLAPCRDDDGVSFTPLCDGASTALTMCPRVLASSCSFAINVAPV